MPKVHTGSVELNYVEQGDAGAVPVVFVHGMMSSHRWLDLTRARLPATMRVIAYDWRGCGDSDKPAAEPGYANYSMETHARDLLGLLDALGIARCHVINHSTGGLITAHALRLAPERFVKLLGIDPVPPIGADLEDGIANGVFEAARTTRAVAFGVLAAAAPSLFVPASLASGDPQWAATARLEQRALFDAVVDQVLGMSDGGCTGTAYHLSAARRDDQGLVKALAGVTQPYHVLWGEQDVYVSRADTEAMVAALPHGTLQILSGIGHSINLEDPAALADIVTKLFS